MKGILQRVTFGLNPLYQTIIIIKEIYFENTNKVRSLLVTLRTAEKASGKYDRVRFKGAQSKKAIIVGHETSKKS